MANSSSVSHWKTELTNGHDLDHGTHTSETNDNSFKIPRSSLLKVLQGVSVAFKLADDTTEAVARFFHSYSKPSHLEVEEETTASAPSLRSWLAAIPVHIIEETPRQVASVAVAVAVLREKCRQATDESTAGALPVDELELVWDLIYHALTSPLLENPLGNVSRSAQGFLAVPLCSLIKDGMIDELYRLHVWLPDGQRGNPDCAIHSHQPFSQSWILAGQGLDCSYEVELNSSPEVATHAEYALAWNDGKSLGKNYNAHQTYSVVANTGKLAHAELTESAAHTRNMTYSIPSAKFHTSVVAPDSVQATLFFFDSHRGFFKDAGVLGPKDGGSYTQVRTAAGITAASLASIVQNVRKWEILMEQAQRHVQRAEWEHALRYFDNALSLCESVENFPNVAPYRNEVLGKLGNTNRRFGRYELAKDILERVLASMELNAQRVECSGELGVVYRHMDRLADAKHAFEMQYEAAKELDIETATCRAVGNLGMVNYQLSQEEHDPKLLDLAISQLLERVERSRQIVASSSISAEKSSALTWEVVSLCRLSICYVARGDVEQGIEAALESLDLTSKSKDTTVIAMTRFFYGHALLAGGQRDKALEQFNPPTGCTPAIALCKEPSNENRQYLREVMDSGADFTLRDEQGYTALDYAVFNGDLAMEEIVLEGLRRTLGGDGVERILPQLLAAARLRKGYRELFQEKLRPVLRGGRSDPESLQRLRHAYADAIAGDETRRAMFDGLAFIPYAKFAGFGRLPRSSDGVVEKFLQPAPDGPGQKEPFVIFFSYRWINKEAGATSPDDGGHTQYRRMLSAVEEFLGAHPSVERESVCIWMDYACVDQDNPSSGVSALPLIIAQCDAVVSIADDSYYTRAWCSVEALMVQTLKKSYGTHMWYEQVPASSAAGEEQGEGAGEQQQKQQQQRWRLREGPMDLDLVIAEKDLSFEEEDRPKVLFLERQSKLFG